MRERHPLDLAGSVELAAVRRSGFDESLHIGAAVVVGPDGRMLRELGDSGADVFGRSTLKPFQALAVLRSGVELEGLSAALATASHSGTPAHVDVVSSMLAASGLDQGDLRCPPAWPTDRAATSAERVSQVAPRRVTMNCSGKHAAFLMACVHNGWSLHDHLEPEHPLQRRIRSTIAELTGDEVGTIGVDGCGAPTFATGLRALATGIGRFAGGSDPDATRIRNAVSADPWAIDGPGRANTTVIERLGIFAKGGAEGVLVLGTADEIGVAVKVLDGSARATTMIGLELLVSVGAISRADADDTIAATTAPVLGGGEPVGALLPLF